MSENYDFREMTRQEIEELKTAINARNLRKKLLLRMRIERRTASYDTITRAFEVEDFHEAGDTLQAYLLAARDIKRADDERIAREIAALESGELLAHA